VQAVREAGMSRPHPAEPATAPELIAQMRELANLSDVFENHFVGADRY
jgi:hypothetical protein